LRTFKRTLIVIAALLFVVGSLAGLTFYFNPLWVSDQTIHFHLWRQHVRSEYVQVDGYRIHYFEALPPVIHGKPLAPEIPLVLIHGLGSRGEDWSGMIPTLAAQGFHVYAPDLLGYGRSSRPADADYSISLQEKTVVDYMQTLGLTRADVGGWSMGGWIALKLTADHPEMVERLVVFDAAGIYFPPTFDASLFTPSDAAGLTKLTSMLSPHPPAMPPFVERAAIRKLRGNAWVIDRSVSSMTAGRDLMDFRLRQIHAPTLLVWGSQDVLIPLSVAERMRRTIPGASLLVIDGCGHLAPAECSTPVLRGTVNFLRAKPPIRGGEQDVPGGPH
jgi:pimeloyl-ACP methyl ester carboxylesterase